MNFFKVVIFLISLIAFTNLDANAQSRYNRDNRPVSITQPYGGASYYGHSWNGRKTACGEIFNTDSFTCAHRTLPFGTMLKVTNKQNGKSVVVRVTDRGPYIKGRIIDLTLAAAKKIDMVHAGVVPVEIAQIYTPSSIPYIQENVTPMFPELQLFDPVTGNYFSMSEWQKRDARRQELAKAKAGNAVPNSTRPTAQASAPKVSKKSVPAPATPAKPVAKVAVKKAGN